MLQKLKQSRQKVKKFVESKSFDLFIMLLICLDAVVFGLMTDEDIFGNFGGELFILDRLCMSIFVVEMALKLYVYGAAFFKSRWNTFDFLVIAVSACSLASYLIAMRTFRLFRLLKYINRFSKLKHILKILGALLPNFAAIMMVFCVFLYVFAVMAVNLFGDVFIEFATLGGSLFALLQVFTLDGWASDIARPVMSVFPHAWIFFTAFLLFSFLLFVSFVMSTIDEIFRRDLWSDKNAERQTSTDALKTLKTPMTKKKPSGRKRRMSPAKLAK
jgi:voltage-gated sodium channel